MRTVALTFDNLGEAAELEQGTWPAGRPLGAHPSVTRVLPKLLDALEAHDLTATFFVEGINAELYPEAVREIAARGHELGLHAWRHERWGELEPARERELLARGLAALRELGLEVTAFRPPGGGLTGRTLANLAAAGVAWCSPEGARSHVSPEGVAVLPFRWPLVDATYLHTPFAGLRASLGLPDEPLDPADAAARLRAELAADPDPVAAVLILHPFLAVDEEVWAMHADLLAELAARRDAGRLDVARPSRSLLSGKTSS